MDVLAQNNRIDYGETLMPDDGWTTSWAIGTTFSLDLEVLLTIPLALFHGKDLHEVPDLNNLRTDMLDSLEKVKDRMFVFVQQNNIKAIKKYSLLMSFVDQNIWEVPIDENQSYHPKLWLIRYEKDNLYKYRLIVMSRNLTSTPDFDISAVMEGECIQKTVDSNDSLISVMTDLMERTGKHTNRTAIINQIRKELKKIKFSAPTPFQENYYEFYIQKGTSNDCPLLVQDFKYKNIMVMSPFVDDKSLKMLKRNTENQAILVSRFEQLDKCIPNTLNEWECYYWASSIADEDYQSGEHSISLHAKIYLIETHMRHLGALCTDRKIWNYWYLGSTNCTTAGIQRNYEALLQLRSDNECLSVNHTINTLLKSNLIIKYNITSDEDFNERKKEQDKLKSLELKMRKCIFKLSSLNITARATSPDNTSKYNVSIVCNKKNWRKYQDDFCNDFKITATLPTGTNETWDLLEKDSIEYNSILCQELSRFLKISVKLKGQFYIPEKTFLVDTKMNIPRQRHKYVIKQILDTNEKILRYLLSILDSNIPDKDQHIGKDNNYHSGKNYSSVWAQYSLPVYEKLLLAASRDTVALKKFICKAEKLKGNKNEKKSILNEDFFKMVDLFKQYAK